MIKSIIGAFLGSLTFAIVVAVVGFLLEWFGFDRGLLVASGGGALVGGVLGWMRPGVFIHTLLFFLEPSVFD